MTVQEENRGKSDSEDLATCSVIGLDTENILAQVKTANSLSEKIRQNPLLLSALIRIPYGLDRLDEKTVTALQKHQEFITRLVTQAFTTLGENPSEKKIATFGVVLNEIRDTVGLSLKGLVLPTNLVGANLRCINLDGCRIHPDGTNLSGAILTGSMVANSSLPGLVASGLAGQFTQWTDTDLSFANLSDATLSDADFTYANLHNATVTGANCIRADFSFPMRQDGKILTLENAHEYPPTMLIMPTLPPSLTDAQGLKLTNESELVWDPSEWHHYAF